MSRSAADATRFTTTSPHAYSKPPTRSSNPPIPPQQRPPSFSSSPTMKNNFKPSSPSSRSGRSGPSGPAETPLEKVARLRAARFAARDAQVTMWDRVVVRGRVWADVAHRITVLGLMASTGTSIPPSLPFSHIQTRSIQPSPPSFPYQPIHRRTNISFST